MRTWTTIAGQTLTDLAIQLYGNEDATAELLSLNDFTKKMVLPNGIDESEIDIAYPLKAATVVTYDETSALVNLQELLALTDPLKGLRMAAIATAESLQLEVFDDTFGDEFE